MYFPVSGVECPIWLPPSVAFVVALLMAPAGISGAFLLLPFQMSVLGFVTPGVTPTNLIYNTVAVPGGVYRYIRERRMVWPLAWAIAAGTLPGVFAGAVIRIRYLPDPRYCKLFVAAVLVYIGIRLLRAPRLPAGASPDPEISLPAVAALALPVGMIGGIYGVGGGVIIAPCVMAIFRLPARTIAGAALLGTLLTSIAGVVFFELLGRTPAGATARPDWALGLLFGGGGLFGSYFGARLQKHLPERWIRLFLGVVVLAVAVAYTAQFFHLKGSR